MDFEFKDKYSIEDLLKIIKLLRSPNGCPWDKKQTHSSLKRNFIEETYEVIEAIDENSSDHLREELGDVLLQVVFHAEIESEKNHFDFLDVANEICQKLIYRHPHVFSNVSVKDSEEVLDNWDKLKMESKKQDTISQTMESVCKSLPSLIRSEKVQKKASKVGFDWCSPLQAFEKITEEANELESAIKNNDKSNIEEEIGDLLFAVVNVSRLLNKDPEQMLHLSCDKFISRFKLVEDIAKSSHKNLSSMSFEEMETLWKLAKEKNLED